MRDDAIRSLFERLRDWWCGAPVRLRMHEDGIGMTISYQDPNTPPMRKRVTVAAKRPVVRWSGWALGSVAVAVIAAAIIKWLGLS